MRSQPSIWAAMRTEVSVGRMLAEEEFGAYQQHRWVVAMGIASPQFRFRRMPAGKMRSWVYYRELLKLIEKDSVSQSETGTATD